MASDVTSIDLPPSQPALNPFGLADDNTGGQSPFSDVAAAQELPPETPATPLRTQVAALAQVGQKASGADSELSVMQLLQQTLDETRNTLDMSEESNLRYQSAGRQVLEKQKALKTLSGNPMISPELQSSIAATSDRNVQTDLDEKAKTATEEEAFSNIRDLLHAGNETEARIALRQYQEGDGSTLAVIKDHAVKRMLLGEALERAESNKDDEGWMHWLLSGAISIPETMLMGESFRALGNVAEGTDGYHGSLFRMLAPGSDLGKQIEAVQGMSPTEFADNLPTLIDNIRSNATTLGVEDPGVEANLLKDFNEGLTNNDIMTRNAWSWADAAGLMPIGTAQKMLRGTSILTSTGARRATANIVASAVESTIAEGAEKAAAKTGLVTNDVIDETLPSAVNPGRPIRNPVVSLSGDVNDTIDTARATLDELKLADTSRYTSQAELNTAVEGTMNRIRERVGTVLKDHEVEKVALPDGTSTYRVVATVGKTEGGGFATADEALGFLESRGYLTDPTMVDSKITEVTTSRRTPRDEGYTTQAYHGTNEDFDAYEPSLGGKLGPGIYLSPKPDVANDYADIVKGAGSNIRPQLINKDKLFGIKNVDGWTPSDISKAYKELGLDPKPFLKQVKEALAKRDAKTVDSQTVIKQLQHEFKNVDKEGDFGFSIGAGLNAKLEDLGYHGIAANMWGDVEYNVFANKNVRSALEAHVVKDISQQYFGKVAMDIPDTAFLSEPLRPPRQSFLSKYWKNPSQTSDRNLFDQAARADQKRNRFYKIIEQNLTKSFRGLTGKERTWMEQILAEGDKRSMWFKDEDFSVLYERATGEPPRGHVLNAYKQYRLNNDLEFVLRDADMYRQKVIRGFESANFSAQGEQFDTDVILDTSPDKVPTKSRIYNLSDDIHYTNTGVHGSVGNLTPEKLTSLRERGYVMFRTENAVPLKDGTTTDWFLAKRNDVQTRPLRRNQLAYKAGGHRLYADKYFVKQASWGIQADTKKRFLENPNVWITAPTVKHARDWAEVMNAARLSVKEEGRGAAWLDENLFKQNKAYPTGKEFLDHVEKGKVDLEEPFEALFDREMPTAYRNKPDLEKFIDEDEVGFNGYYRTTGKMYYSPKGEALKDYTGEYAPTIDPFKAQARALSNVSQMSSFSDFKTSAIDRWVRTYKAELNTRDLPAEQAASPAHIFNSATVSRDTPVSLRQQMEGQRETIKRILGFRSEWDRTVANFQRSTAEWIAGDSDNAMRQWAAKNTFTLSEKNPIGFLRGLAFDMKLGFFNLGQFFIQTSTMASALAMSPKYGFQGMASAIPVFSYFLSKSSENVLETLTKRGVHKIAGFADAEEFKDYVRDASRGGFFDVGDTHVMVNNIGPANTFGSISGGIEAVREQGRMFFYTAEVFNRLTAYRIAYGEAVDKFGRAAKDSIEFKNYLSGRAENYSFNMSNVSKSAWQSGLLSIPTQFWAYNVRMLEAMTGSNFTNAQKLRLLGSQVLMAGSGGVPIVAGISDMLQTHYGVKPKIDTMLGTLDRGVADRMAYEMFGADVEVGEKWGTGSWSGDLLKDIFGYSEYNQKSFADMAGGATAGIMGTAIPLFGQALGSAVEVAKYWMANESGSEKVALSEDQWINLAKQVSTFNNGFKAMMIHEYGVLQSTKGADTPHIPTQDAMFVAMGFQPAEMDEVGVLMAYKKNRKESVEEAAKVINNKLQESILIPSKFEQNAAEVNALVNIIPPELRQDVLRKVQGTRDPSLYDSLLNWKEKQDFMDAQAKGTTE